MKEFRQSRRSSFGSFIVDGRGTILGFDQALEDLTGWPATDVVGRHKDLGLPSLRPDPVARRTARASAIRSSSLRSASAKAPGEWLSTSISP